MTVTLDVVFPLTVILFLREALWKAFVLKCDWFPLFSFFIALSLALSLYPMMARWINALICHVAFIPPSFPEMV